MNDIKGNWNPDQYDKFKNERTQPFIDLMSFIQPQDFQRAVDLGCGTGELTHLFHQSFKPQTTLGIDSSREMLQKSLLHSAPGLTFIQDNIETWKPSEKVDLIISNAALQWCSNHSELFKNLYQSLSTGGQLAVQMPMNHDYPTHVLAYDMSFEAKWNQHLNGKAYTKYDLFSVEEYAALLYRLGFREQTVVLKVYPHVLGSREEVLEWVKGSMLSFFRQNLTEEHYQEFLQEFRERLFKRLPDDKPFFYPFKRLHLWARV
ncbi:trans-aconitate methyltransferase [Bacteriovorax stolpii]|uniref:methyltransferase domain-containing protein n=1 Tax=Bacteriovorax stolpii TaxID=960 RepID=UPI001158D5B8|nr:methyltransferase domain-containing protein [Bacteriovorax stolpii]QDK41210.1 trans-aconitate methyltransferase [Bacteriovorax stolpii]